MAHRIELHEPRKILATDYQHLELEQIREYLRLLVLAEKDSSDPQAHMYKKLRPYQCKFIKRRLQVSSLYESKGGKLSPLMFKAKLPEKQSWPGVVGLIATPGEEQHLIDDDT